MLAAFASIAFALSSPVAASQAETAAATQTLVVERTYLKATSGKQDALAKFIVANWFAMDRAAVKQGLFTSYLLSENLDPDADWDFEVAVGYPNVDGYQNVDVQTRFAAIRRNHQTILIDGQGLAELGRIVHSDRIRPRQEN